MRAPERAHTPLNRIRVNTEFVLALFVGISPITHGTLYQRYKLVIQKNQPILGQAEHCVLNAYSYRWSMTGPLWYAFVTIVNITFRLIAPLSAWLYRGFNVPVARKFLHVKSMICLAWSLYPILCYSNNFRQLQRDKGPAQSVFYDDGGLNYCAIYVTSCKYRDFSPCWDASYTWP